METVKKYFDYIEKKNELYIKFKFKLMKNFLKKI